MSDDNKPKLEVVPPNEGTTDEAKSFDQFDHFERSAFLMDKEHPVVLKKLVKVLSKRPGALARLTYNLLMEPFDALPLQGKDENEAWEYFKHILRDKNNIAYYNQMRKEGAQNGEKEK